MMYAVVFTVLLALLASSHAFVSTSSPLNRMAQASSPRKMELHMGGKMSKFGIFSPAVYAAKVVLGEKKLEKVQILYDFLCNYTGEDLLPLIHLLYLFYYMQTVDVYSYT